MTDPLDFGVNLESVRERFLALGYFLTVRDIQAASLAIQEEIIRPPVAFVSIASEVADPKKLIGGDPSNAQHVAVTLSVLFAERIGRAAKDTRDAVDRTRRAVIIQGVHWTPTGANAALKYDRFLNRGVVGDSILGEVLFRTSYRFNG